MCQYTNTQNASLPSVFLVLPIILSAIFGMEICSGEAACFKLRCTFLMLFCGTEGESFILADGEDLAQDVMHNLFKCFLFKGVLQCMQRRVE